MSSLPYLTWNAIAQEDRAKQGVVAHDVERAYRGLSLFKSRDEAAASLIDMDGHPVHTWNIVASDGSRPDVKHVEINDRGELFAVRRDQSIIKVGWNSELLWEAQGRRFHHDLDIAYPEEIYALARAVWTTQHAGKPIPVIDDLVVVLSPQGERLREYPLWSVFSDRVSERRLDAIAQHVEAKNGQISMIDFTDGSGYDVLHDNTVERIDRTVEGFASEGDILLSLREIDTIAVIDIRGEQARLVWDFGPGELQAQHQPTMLDDGHLLVFDNGRARKWSRVVELDPVTKQIVWQYVGSPPESFFSAIRGGAERLGNGNTLVTESDKGHVFEVTRSGEIVWDFWNPRTQDDGAERAAIYRMGRLSPATAGKLPFDDVTRARLKRDGYVAESPSPVNDAG